MSRRLASTSCIAKQFYDSLLNDYFDSSRTIVVTTHQVEEIQDVLTDLMFINRGRIVLECSMEEFESRYLEVMVNPEHVAAARALKPIHERPVFGRSVMLFDRARSRAARRARRSAPAEHRRLVCCGDEQGQQTGLPTTRTTDAGAEAAMTEARMTKDENDANDIPNQTSVSARRNQ